MKELDELHLPDDIRYTDEHEWARITGDIARIGVSDYAQDQLGDIVFVELPAVGDTIARGEVFGTLESVKAVSELYLPLSGEVVAVNTALVDAPELINQQWVRRYDLRLRLRRKIERTYPVLNILSADTPVITG